jgi:hypothetical protein
MHKVKEF